MFSFKGKICRSAILPHHTKTTLDELRERKLNFYPPLGLMLNALHQQTGMITEPQLKWIRPREASKETAVINWGLVTPIFLSRVIKHPRVQIRSESVSHHWHEEHKSLETVLHGGGCNGCNVSFPWALPESGASLVAASCSYQTECSSACLSEFTPRASCAIILNGGR